MGTHSMDDDIKYRIERVKKELSDFIRLTPYIDLDKVARDRRIDIFLDDLSNLLKQLDNDII